MLVFTIDTNSFAQGNLMIYPRRLEFKANQRTLDVTLANAGSDSSAYTLSWKNYRMTPSGQFEEVTLPDSGQFFAEPVLRFYPREVILGPGESQKVRIQKVRNTTLPDGEYRSHLEFRSKNALPTANTGQKSDEGIQTQLSMHLAITIPVIMEYGNLNAQVQLQNPRLLNLPTKGEVIEFDILREGNKSVYGDFVVHHQAANGSRTQIGLVKGVAVYHPIAKRHYALAFKFPESIPMRSGKLVVEYLAQDRKKEVLATLELPLQ